MITTTTNTTAVMITVMYGMFSRRSHSLLSPLGFRLVFLYFLRSFCSMWSTVATSTDTSAIYSQTGEHSHGHSKLYITWTAHFACPLEQSHKRANYGNGFNGAEIIGKEHQKQLTVHYEDSGSGRGWSQLSGGRPSSSYLFTVSAGQLSSITVSWIINPKCMSDRGSE